MYCIVHRGFKSVFSIGTIQTRGKDRSVERFFVLNISDFSFLECAKALPNSLQKSSSMDDFLALNLFFLQKNIEKYLKSIVFLI